VGWGDLVPPVLNTWRKRPYEGSKLEFVEKKTAVTNESLRATGRANNTKETRWGGGKRLKEIKSGVAGNLHWQRGSVRKRNQKKEGSPSWAITEELK